MNISFFSRIKEQTDDLFWNAYYRIAYFRAASKKQAVKPLDPTSLLMKDVEEGEKNFKRFTEQAKELGLTQEETAAGLGVMKHLHLLFSVNKYFPEDSRQNLMPHIAETLELKLAALEERTRLLIDTIEIENTPLDHPGPDYTELTKTIFTKINQMIASSAPGDLSP